MALIHSGVHLRERKSQYSAKCSWRIRRTWNCSPVTVSVSVRGLTSAWSRLEFLLVSFAKLESGAVDQVQHPRAVSLWFSLFCVQVCVTGCEMLEQGTW